MRHALRLLVAATLTVPLLLLANFFRERARPAPPAPDYGPAPAFALVERSGRPFSSAAELSGRTWIADFIFTRCTGPCPKMTAHMKRIERALADAPGGARVRLVSFTLDPTYDTPAVLSRYADAAGAPRDGRWVFLTSPRPDDLERLSIDGFKLGAGRDDGAVVHSTRLILVDGGGTVRGYYDGEDEAAVYRLIADAQRLAALDVAAATAAAAATAPPAEPSLSTYRALPHLNAALNATCALLLLAGYIAVKQRRIALHKACMVSALGVSIVFLASYLVYHAHAGSKPFAGTGVVRPVYFSILLSHTVLAAAVPFLATVTAWRGFRGAIARHKRLARVTLPIWLYVSVTGVVVYAMLYHLYPGAVPPP